MFICHNFFTEKVPSVTAAMATTASSEYLSKIDISNVMFSSAMSPLVASVNTPEQADSKVLESSIEMSSSYPMSLSSMSVQEPAANYSNDTGSNEQPPLLNQTCQQLLYTSNSKVKVSTTPESRVKRDVCFLELLSKNLARHKRTVHSKATKHINQDRHHRAVCVDASRGLYLVSQTLRGVAHPIHVQKITLPENSASICELSKCLDVKKTAARSFRPSFECDHVQSVCYAESYLPNVKLRDDSLDCLVKRHLREHSIAPGDCWLSIDPWVALWLDYRSFNNMPPLKTAGDFVLVSIDQHIQQRDFTSSTTTFDIRLLPAVDLFKF